MLIPNVLLWSAQLLVRRWNPRLSRDILASWLDLLNSQGWIAREQATFLRLFLNSITSARAVYLPV